MCKVWCGLCGAAAAIVWVIAGSVGGAAEREQDGAGTPTGATGTKAVRVFYCTHSAGFRHDVLDESRELVKAWGAELDWLETAVSDDIADLTKQRLAETDVVMLFTTGDLPMGEMYDALLAWVREGGAIVGVHSATDTYHSKPDFISLIGGEFDGHPWDEEVKIIAHEPTDPIMAAWVEGVSPDKDGLVRFTVTDEIYQLKNINPDLCVLVRLDPANPKTEAGRAYPLIYSRSEGKGRVFYTALGHRPEVWKDPRFVKSLLAGMRWAGQAE